MLETDEGADFVSKVFTKLLNSNNLKRYSKNPGLVAVFAGRFNRIIRDLLKRPVFEKGDGIWVDMLPAKAKPYNHRTNSSTKLTPTQTSLKKNEGLNYKKLLDKRKEIKPKFKFTASSKHQI